MAARLAFGLHVRCAVSEDGARSTYYFGASTPNFGYHKLWKRHNEVLLQISNRNGRGYGITMASECSICMIAPPRRSLYTVSLFFRVMACFDQPILVQFDVGRRGVRKNFSHTVRHLTFV